MIMTNGVSLCRELVAKLEKNYYLGKRELDQITKECKSLEDLLAELGKKYEGARIL